MMSSSVSAVASSSSSLPTIKHAVILAAGRGTRMGELTNELPKPMIPVHGKPILDHIVEGLKDAGVTNILIIVGYKAEVIKTHFQDGSQFGVKIQFTHQIVQDGTGRVVQLAKEFCGKEGFILTYGDILIDPTNYRVLASPLITDEAIISVKHNEDTSKGGAVFINERNELVDLKEKVSSKELSSPWYNAGVYFFRASIFEFCAKLTPSPRGEYELTDAIRDLAQSGQVVRAYELVGDWADVRDPDVLAQLEKSYL